VELRALYQNANFLVLPLEESTANNSILEALACGIPVITTQTSGIGDYVDHSCARVCKPGDARDVTLQIGSLFENTVLQSSMSVAAREKAVSQFSWEKVSNEVAGLYRNVIYASRGNS
jgi:glycosyltransferase involved in cell wall biosynthesis